MTCTNRLLAALGQHSHFTAMQGKDASRHGSASRAGSLASVGEAAGLLTEEGDPEAQTSPRK